MSTFTTRQLDLRRVPWLSGASTVGEVRHALAESGIERAYDTVLTILRILREKGHVGQEPAGRADRFRAFLARDAASRTATRRPPPAARSTGFFDPSAQALLTHLMRSEGLDRAALERLPGCEPRRFSNLLRKHDLKLWRRNDD